MKEAYLINYTIYLNNNKEYIKKININIFLKSLYLLVFLLKNIILDIFYKKRRIFINFIEYNNNVEIFIHIILINP